MFWENFIPKQKKTIFRAKAAVPALHPLKYLPLTEAILAGASPDEASLFRFLSSDALEVSTSASEA